MGLFFGIIITTISLVYHFVPMEEFSSSFDPNSYNNYMQHWEGHRNESDYHFEYFIKTLVLLIFGILCLTVLRNKFDENFNTHEILVNEETKNITTVDKIWEIMHSNSVTRSTNVICIGGGILCDVVGFATSTYKRGANLILVPTSLLAMVDASHGGKNGVNNNYGKNQIGTFYLQNEVLVCVEFLNSLNKEEINTGLIEVIKAGFIGNNKILELVYGDDSVYSDKSLLQLAIDVKTKITKEDLKESNTRMYLNFGHTIGLLIESDSNYQISHGQAVGIGILIALEISEKEYNLDQSYRKNYMTFLNNAGLKSHYKFKKTRSELITILSNDKKVNN